MEEIADHRIGLGLAELDLRRADRRAAAKTAGREPLLMAALDAGPGQRELQSGNAVAIRRRLPLFRRPGMAQIPRHAEPNSVDRAQTQAFAFRPIDRAGMEHEGRYRATLLVGQSLPLDGKAIGVAEENAVARFALLQGEHGIDPIEKCHDRAGQKHQQSAVRDHKTELPRLPGKANQRGRENVHAQHAQQGDEPVRGVHVPTGIVAAMGRFDKSRRGQHACQEHNQRDRQFQGSEEAEGGFRPSQQSGIAHSRRSSWREMLGSFPGRGA